MINTETYGEEISFQFLYLSSEDFRTDRRKKDGTLKMGY